MLRFPPRRILVAVDFSDASARALRAAKLLARRCHASLEAVYCEAPLTAELFAYGPYAEDRENLRRTVRNLRLRVTGDLPLHAGYGEPATLIARVARRRGADLVVVGTHGRRGLLRALLGSVAESVIRESPAPVLVVRKNFRPPRRVLAPIAEDRDAARGLLAAGLVARAFKARLDVLHVIEDPIFGTNPERLLSARLRRLPKNVRRDTHPTAEVKLGRPVPTILRATRGRDLMVLLARPKSLLGDMVLGTTAERLARFSPIPVLAIPAAASGGGRE
ncbi:MAG: universal stress protein [Elusimicrobia bacterium]|nr:universal stress protein [Elusimicrobiota bacterium]